MKYVFRCEKKKTFKSIVPIISFLFSLALVSINIIDSEQVVYGHHIVYMTGDIIASGIMPLVGMLSAFLIIESYGSGTITEYVCSGISRRHIMESELIFYTLFLTFNCMVSLILPIVFVSITRSGYSDSFNQTMVIYWIRALLCIIVYSAFYTSITLLFVSVIPNILAIPVQYLVIESIGSILGVIVNKLGFLVDLEPAKAAGLSTYPDISTIHAFGDLLGLIAGTIIIFFLAYFIFGNKELRD